MDLMKTGKFIAALRKAKGLTQEELGARLGVSAKTVSRWERGSVSPDVDALLALGRELDADIRELIAGERLASGTESAAAAEESGKAVNGEEPRRSPFTRREAEAYWKRKWERDHRGTAALCCILTAALFIAGGLYFRSLPAALGLLAPALALVLVVFYNKKMVYTENCLYAADTVYAEDGDLPKTRGQSAEYSLAMALLYGLNSVVWAVNLFRHFGEETSGTDILRGVTVLCFGAAALCMFVVWLKKRGAEQDGRKR